jgi:lysozyme family protein
MKENFDDALKAILKHEGGFVNHPKDPGGMTNLGVTKKVWEAWVGHAVDEKEMRALTPEVVGPMYKKKYWDAVKADEMPDGLDYLMFDFAVNAGPRRAIKTMQKAYGHNPGRRDWPQNHGGIKSCQSERISGKIQCRKGSVLPQSAYVRNVW